MCAYFFCFFKQKTAYEMRISDWSSDVCSSDLRSLPAVSSRPGLAIEDVLRELTAGSDRGRVLEYIERIVEVRDVHPFRSVDIVDLDDRFVVAGIAMVLAQDVGIDLRQSVAGQRFAAIGPRMHFALERGEHGLAEISRTQTLECRAKVETLLVIGFRDLQHEIGRAHV